MRALDSFGYGIFVFFSDLLRDPGDLRVLLKEFFSACSARSKSVKSMSA